MTARFTGRVALVSGAARGIGAAIAVRLADEGADVIAFDLAAAFEAAPATRVSVNGDVSIAADWQAAIAACLARFGRLDVLVNNAGIGGSIGPMIDYPDEIFDRVMAVNTRGVFLGMKTAAPVMRATGGAIVNIGSVSGMGGGRNVFAYSASKHAVVGMTKVAAVELAPWKIRVNALCPAPTATEMMFDLERTHAPDDPGRVRRLFEDMIPLGRYGEPDEAAAAVAFLASDDAAFITGAILPIDGGMLAR